MTTELTKAAQQALKPHQIAQLVNKLRDIAREFHAHGCLRELISREINDAHNDLSKSILPNVQPALTQRPAAQTEREAFEHTMSERYGWVPKDFKRDDFGYFDGHANTAWAAWQARASLPAPQQATPEPCKDDVALALAAAQQSYPNPGEPEAGWCLLERKHVEVLCRAAQQATPEPSRGMIGMGAHALANELAQAVAQDDADPDGHDVSAGLFGPNVSAWLRKVATEYLSKGPAKNPCRGITDTDCGYLSTCGAICNKCGKEHRGQAQATPEPVGEPICTIYRGGLGGEFGKSTILQAWHPSADQLPDGEHILYDRPAPGVPESPYQLRKRFEQHMRDAFACKDTAFLSIDGGKTYLDGSMDNHWRTWLAAQAKQ